MKKTKLAIALMTAFCSTQANALGMGAPVVESYLGEPVSIKAPLMLTPFERSKLESSSISIGDQAMFKRFGLQFPSGYAGLETEIVMVGHQPVMHLKSKTLFREPMLELPLDIKVGNSRLIKVVTLLFDPRPEKPAPAVSPETSVSSAPQQARPVSKSVAVAAPASVAKRSNVMQPARHNSEYGPVAVSQTLGDIAREVGYSDATVYQNLVALWEANPDAFLHGNMNYLKAGSTLHIPRHDEVMHYRVDAAKREVLAQYNAGKRGTAVAASPTREERATVEEKVAIADSSAPSLSVDDTGENPRLKITAALPQEEIPAEFREEFNALYVALDERETENTELRSRLNLLERQVTAMSKLMLADAAETVSALEKAANVAGLVEAEAKTSAEDATEVPTELIVEGSTVAAAPVLQQANSAIEIIRPQPFIATPTEAEGSNGKLWSAFGAMLGGLLIAALWLVNRRRQTGRLQQLFQ